jgi:hypothetical protein
MKKLSTGRDSTLGNYLTMTKCVFGVGKASDYLQDKIDKSPQGGEEEVIADEGQMVQLFLQLQYG